MAVLLSNISAASLINLADSTSALAEINFDSANLLSLAADDNVSYKSFESLISFIYIFSTLIPHSLTYRSTYFSISSAISVLFSKMSYKMNYPAIFFKIA